MLCCFTSDIRTETDLFGLETMYGLILKLSNLNSIHYTPGVSGVDCCASLPQSRVDSFYVHCVQTYQTKIFHTKTDYNPRTEYQFIYKMDD